MEECVLSKPLRGQHMNPVGDAHYHDVIMEAIASQITSLTSVYSIVYSDADQRKHQSFASLAFVWGIHRGPVNSPHKWPVTRKMFPFDDVIMPPTVGIHCLHEHLPGEPVIMYLDEMTDILPTTFSNAFQKTKISEVWYDFHWSALRGSN